MNDNKQAAVAFESGRMVGYCRALWGTEASEPDSYLLSASLSSYWHKGYRVGLIDGGKELEKGVCL